MRYYWRFFCETLGFMIDDIWGAHQVLPRSYHYGMVRPWDSEYCIHFGVLDDRGQW